MTPIDLINKQSRLTEEIKKYQKEGNKEKLNQAKHEKAILDILYDQIRGGITSR